MTSRISLIVLFAMAAPVAAQEKTFGIWDTGVSSTKPLSVEAIAGKSGWTPIAKDASVVAGDAVLGNGRVLVVARKGADGVELYSLGSGSPIFRAKLVPTPAGAIDKIAVSENGRSTVAIDVTTKVGTTQIRLKKGEHFVETRALAGTTALRVECPSRFAVLPDFFADDILFDAKKVPVDRVELPSENFVLHFTGKQDAIVMNVFENRDQDVRVNLAGKGDARAIASSEIDFGKAGSKIWVAVLEGPGIWHSTDLGRADAKKVIPLGWKMPFVAQWRADFTRHDGLTDSWEMLLANKEGGGYTKPSWLSQEGKISDASRTSSGLVDQEAYKPGGPASDQLPPDRPRWTTVLGFVPYPVWSDLDRERLPPAARTPPAQIRRAGRDLSAGPGPADTPVAAVHAVGRHRAGDHGSRAVPAHSRHRGAEAGARRSGHVSCPHVSVPDLRGGTAEGQEERDRQLHRRRSRLRDAHPQADRRLRRVRQGDAEVSSISSGRPIPS